MDDQGWGLRTMLGLCAILAFLLFFVAINIKSNFKDIFYNSSTTNDNTNDEKPGRNVKSNSYDEIETNLIDGAKKYVSDYYSEGIPEGVRLTFTIKDLQQKGYLELINDPNNNSITCSGYINVIEGEYHPYLKCGKKYQTKGYNEQFDSN